MEVIHVSQRVERCLIQLFTELLRASLSQHGFSLLFLAHALLIESLSVVGSNRRTSGDCAPGLIVDFHLCIFTLEVTVTPL